MNDFLYADTDTQYDKSLKEKKRTDRWKMHLPAIRYSVYSLGVCVFFVGFVFIKPLSCAAWMLFLCGSCGGRVVLCF